MIFCALCNEEIHEHQKFAGIMIYGWQKYYHDECGVNMVRSDLEAKHFWLGFPNQCGECGCGRECKKYKGFISDKEVWLCNECHP